jgi:lipopolysaccharide/colanic/teichoic acid biosynthesis glycosyltransferase
MIRIFRVLVPASVLALFLSEIALVFACYAAAAYGDPDVDGDIFLVDESGLPRIAIVVALTILGLYFHNLYGDVRITNRTRLLQRLCFITGVVFLAQALIGYWNRDLALPRKIMILGSTLALLGIFGWRLLFSAAMRNAVGVRRVLFLGITPTVAQLAGHLGQHPELGLAPIGYLDRGGDGLGASTPLARLGAVADLTHVIEEHHPDWIVIGKREEIPPWWADDFLELRFGGIRAERASALYENTFGRVSALEIRPAELIFGDTLRPSPVWVNLQSAYSLALAPIAFVLALPLLLLIALLVKITSRGPVLLRERRAGLQAAPFDLYRFRCVYRERKGREPRRHTDRELAAFPQEAGGRLTPLGRLLRKLRLDGLPQLANVLRGDMSLVGPRAVRPEFAARLSELIPFYSQRHLVRPGLTGWAQVSADTGAAAPDALGLLEYDLHYIRNLSPALDLLILLSAVRSAFSRN